MKKKQEAAKSSRQSVVGDRQYAIGIDVGATNIKVVAVSPSGDVLAQVREATWDSHVFQETSPSRAWAGKVKLLLRKIEKQQEAPASWLGLAAPGLAAPDNRSIAFMPGRLPGLEGLDWAKFLGRKQPVLVLNDAHAALVGEHWKGAARGFSHVLMLTLGTGVGGAIMMNGRLVQGSRGRAGHFGHICLNPSDLPDIVGIPGSLEDAVGECSLNRRSGARYASTEKLLEDYRGGDPQATLIWLKAVRELACGIASLVNILDPEAVIIGGGIAQSKEVLFEPLNRFLDQVEWQIGGRRVQLLAARLGDLSGALGAARFAILQ